MIIDCAQYVGPCECGRAHELETKKVVVEYGAMDRFEEYMGSLGLNGRRTVIYDTNTYNNPSIKHPRADQEIVLEAEGLYSEKTLIEDMMSKLRAPEIIVAVGSGTIMDFGRYPAFKLGIPFVAIPTLSSSDGYTANVCSIIIDGQKKSIPMKAPTLVVTDLDTISAAPMFLTVSGISDILSKYISIADWKIAHIAAGEYFCPMVCDMAQQALDMMRAAADELAEGKAPDYETITLSLMLSGLTIQLLNSSRAASGAEHLLAHLVEMKPPRFENAHGMHGQCVGVGTYLCAREYHRIASLPKPGTKAFKPLDREWIEEKFGVHLAKGIEIENENDVLSTFNPASITENWEELCKIINAIPDDKELETLYSAIGAKYRPEHIGIDPALGDEMLDISAAIRNRLTLVRMRRVLDIDRERRL